MSPPETSTPKMATRSWTSSATSIKAVPPSAWSPTTLDTPTTPSAPSISSMEELLKRPNRLHYEVMQRSHEAQPVSLGTDGWPTGDILDATCLLIVRKSRRARKLVRSRSPSDVSEARIDERVRKERDAPARFRYIDLKGGARGCGGRGRYGDWMELRRGVEVGLGCAAEQGKH